MGRIQQLLKMCNDLDEASQAIHLVCNFQKYFEKTMCKFGLSS